MKTLWQTLDTTAVVQRRNEQTTSGNVGAYPVPLGTPMRQTFPTNVAVDPLQQLAGGDPEYARALRSMGWIK